MDLKVLAHSIDGTMNILIDGKEYVYFLDAIYIPLVLTKIKKSDGRALNFLKEKARDCIEIKKSVESVHAN